MTRERSLTLIATLVFVVGIVIGGGRTSPSIALFTEALASVLLAGAVASMIDVGFRKETFPALLLLSLICAVPLLQLIPLPAGEWRLLPGRGVADSISQLAGLGDQARPMSLAPEETRLALLSLIVPAAIFVATIQISARSRDDIMIVIVAVALISALLGVFQAAAGSGVNLGIYRQVSDGYPIGFFANRNHEADLLLVAMPLTVHLTRIRPWPHRRQVLVIGLALVFFSLSVIVTQSRTALALLPIALSGALIIWIGDIWDRRVWLGAGCMLFVAVAAYAILRLTPVGHKVIHHFSTVGEDLRPVFWKGTWTAIWQFWPLGSGTGSFVPAYKMFEDLDFVSDAWVNHAHNEYLELMLENGIVAPLLLTAYAVIVFFSFFRHVPRKLNGQKYVAITSLAILLGHSITDYPLRTFGLAAVFAFANGMLFPIKERHRIRRSGPHPAIPPPAFAPSHSEVKEGLENPGPCGGAHAPTNAKTGLTDRGNQS